MGNLLTMPFSLAMFCLLIIIVCGWLAGGLLWFAFFGGDHG
jgi:hypothetical protein